MKDDSAFEFFRSSERLSPESQAKWMNLASYLACLESIGLEGANVLLKVDGGRTNGAVYTVVISGGRFGDEYFRKDGSDLVELMREAIQFYISRSSA